MDDGCLRFSFSLLLIINFLVLIYSSLAFRFERFRFDGRGSHFAIHIHIIYVRQPKTIVKICNGNNISLGSNGFDITMQKLNI